MSLDKFGRYSETIRKNGVKSQATSYQLNYTNDGDFDMDSRKLCNLKDPSSSQDAATKTYVDKLFSEIKEKIEQDIELRLEEHRIQLNTYIKTINENREYILKLYQQTP